MYIFAFFPGAYWSQGASGTQAETTFIELVVIWLIAVVMLVPAFVRRPLFNFNALCRIAVPIASILLLADPLSFFGPDAGLLSGAFKFCCLMLFMVTSWSALAIASSRFSVPSDILFSANQIVSYFLYMAGIAATLYANHAVLEIAVSAAAIVFVVAVIVSYVTEVTSKQVEPDGAKTDEDAFQERIQTIADRYGLTKRETEIFAYLTQGRGSTFIGKELFISASTVQTHRSHIYKKLGVSSREELIDISAKY